MSLLAFLLLAVLLLADSTQARSDFLHQKHTNSRPPTAKGSDAPVARTRCNGYAEFCGRRYSNVTMVGAHNSPFVQRHNLAANQARNVTQQLDDGVRFLQAQMQWPANSTAGPATPPHFCHTSCALLDAGPITDWLGAVRGWVAAHPDDVVTVLLGNGNYSAAARYAPYIAASGLVPYAYVPPGRTTTADGGRGGRGGAHAWPTLGAMLAAGQRVVLLLDYKADEAAFPWLLDEFAYAWETPFDPLVGAPPNCSVQRPPGLAPGDARSDARLYLMNHNLNVEVTLWNYSFMIPASVVANETNADRGAAGVGVAADACTGRWGRPPNVLNVDYYDRGGPPGSVFQVAARLNGVPYNATYYNQSAPATSAAARGRGAVWLCLVTLAALGMAAGLF